MWVRGSLSGRPCPERDQGAVQFQDTALASSELEDPRDLERHPEEIPNLQRSLPGPRSYAQFCPANLLMPRILEALRLVN